MKLYEGTLLGDGDFDSLEGVEFKLGDTSKNPCEDKDRGICDISMLEALPKSSGRDWFFPIKLERCPTKQDLEKILQDMWLDNHPNCKIIVNNDTTVSELRALCDDIFDLKGFQI